MDGGPVPSSLCPRCATKNLADQGKTFVKVTKAKKKEYLAQSMFYAIYLRIQEWIAYAATWLYHRGEHFCAFAGRLDHELTSTSQYGEF